MKRILTHLGHFAWLQALSCLFPILLFLTFAITKQLCVPGLHRYDLILLICLIVQIILYKTGLETKDELKVIAVFHLVGLCQEQDRRGTTLQRLYVRQRRQLSLSGLAEAAGHPVRLAPRLGRLGALRGNLRELLHGTLAARCPLGAGPGNSPLVPAHAGPICRLRDTLRPADAHGVSAARFLLMDRGKHRDVFRGLAISKPAWGMASGPSCENEFVVPAGHLQLFDCRAAEASKGGPTYGSISMVSV